MPNPNISNHINVAGTSYSGNFGSNQTNPLHGLPGAKWNVDAINSVVPGIYLSGGKKNTNINTKIKNITKQYKMYSCKKLNNLRRTLKQKLRNLKCKCKHCSSRKRTTTQLRIRKTSKRKLTNKTKNKRGGYAQYQNNLPMTPTYSVGEHLSNSNSALASPPPINVLSNCTNCVDNYNHYTNKGFPSEGH